MKKIDIPRRPKTRTFSEKFNKDNAFFGSREKKEPPRFGQVPLLLACFLGAAVLCLAVLLLGRLWKVTAVSAEDGQLYSATALIEYAGVEAGDEMLGFDCGAIERRLKEGLPLLDRIQVRRRLNGTVTIRVTEETELYYTRHNMNYYIISATTRRVLCVASSPTEARRVGAVYVGIPESARVRVGEQIRFINLPYAPESSAEGEVTYEGLISEPDEKYAYVFTFVEMLAETPLFERVVGMELGDRYDLWLVLEGRIKVRVGSMDELDRKLTMVERSLADQEAEGDLSGELPTLVDVSDPARIIHRTSPDVDIPDWGL